MKKARLNIKKSNKKEEIIKNDEFSIRKGFIIIVTIIVIFIAFYFLTDYLLSKRTVNNKTTEPEVSNEISFNKLYKQSDELYYVLAILEDDDNKDKYQIYTKDLSPLYYINMKDAFNKNHISDKTVVGEVVKDININDSTLFVIKDNKLDSYHVGFDNITEYIVSTKKSVEK